MRDENTPLISNSNHIETHSNGGLLAERPSQGSSLKAFANIVCVVAGTGTLGLPYALRLGGWIGVGILIFSLFMALYTSILLMKCLYYNGKYRLTSYPDIGFHAFGRAGSIAVWAFYAPLIIGAPIMYLILSGTELKNLITVVDMSTRTWIWISAAIVAVPFVLMKTLKEVAIMSIFGALATVVLVIVAVRGSIVDHSNPIYSDVNHDFVILPNLPIAIASISFCFSGNIVYVHVEESMRYPKSWNKVVAAALGSCTVLYLATAIPGYFTYGDRAQSPILANLPKDVFTKVGTIFIIAHVILAAPILLTTFALEIERRIGITVELHGEAMERVYRILFRLFIAGFCGAIACIVPYFGDFLSLLGALGNCTLIYVLPILCYFKLIGWRHMRWYELAWCAFIVVTGILSATIGSIDAIRALKRDFDNDSGN
ncbi:hypothetical protein BGX21_003273 [Mortierella sp. AD011]|nr:hypothetical protein BGX20_000926 [Mortierella sp. AD010]KAF9377158.1 hypothetical protein BGX21_003273 [Mortierella sp. AD011]